MTEGSDFQLVIPYYAREIVVFQSLCISLMDMQHKIAEFFL